MVSPRIVLTGGSKGMGLAVLRILLERYNARVTTLSRSYPVELKTVVEKYGPERVIVVQGDVGKSEDNIKVVKTAVEAFGGLDSMILNAATLDPVGELPSQRLLVESIMSLLAGRLADISQDALVPYLQINILSTIYIIQAALPHLRKEGGRVVVVSSGAATGAYGAWGLYSMSKAAQNSLIRTLAIEEKANGVSAFAVRPGVVDVSPLPGIIANHTHTD
jgi:NAD(P)-dependent dehydrogenase (short-subunit alcohol dehydrogenase family)